MSNSKVTAVLLDTVSIQKYIFSGRKLREFIGASYIVDWIYDKPILITLRELFPRSSSLNITDWANNPKKIDITSGCEFEIGYIGGGNALIFFKETTKAEEFIKRWTLKLLYQAPGLIPSAAILENFDLADYKSSLKSLFNKLEENKNSYPVNVFIPRQGISAECQYSGLAKEIYHRFPDASDSDFISSAVKTKLNFAEESNKNFSLNLLPDDNGSNYCFPLEIDQLGQIKGEENYIAIVHIDGNSTGQLFQDCESLPDTRKLSKYLKDKTAETMKGLITTLIDELNNKISPLNNFLELQKNLTDNKICLPIRPIIIGGDDVTFVSNGKLGIWLAEKFIELYTKITQNNDFKSNFTLSAGILICKSHMPFYRAYRLSEELCVEAKKKRKMTGSDTSWIDFHVSYGGFSGNLKEIREKHYKVMINGRRHSIILRPYPVTGNGQTFENLKNSTRDLKKLPKNKLLELRKIIASGDQTGAKKFISNLKIRGHHLPAFPGGNFQINIWDKHQTPYFDMIELLEFYPL